MHSQGDRVLCIRSGWGDFGTRSNPWNVRGPTRGRLYTIRACWQTSSGLWWVYVHEIVNAGTGSGGLEPYFQANQFVPVKRVRTDISVFTGILRIAERRSVVPADQNFDEREAEQRPRRER